VIEFTSQPNLVAIGGYDVLQESDFFCCWQYCFLEPGASPAFQDVAFVAEDAVVSLNVEAGAPWHPVSGI